MEGGSLVSLSGGTIVINFGHVDEVPFGIYASDEGDAAIVAHEAGGHAADYERGRDDYVGVKYSKQERMADKHRNRIVKELRKLKKEELKKQEKEFLPE